MKGIKSKMSRRVNNEMKIITSSFLSFQPQHAYGRALISFLIVLNKSGSGNYL